MKLESINKIEQKSYYKKPFKNQQNKHLLTLLYVFLYRQKKILFFNPPLVIKTKFKTISMISTLELETLSEKDIILTISRYDMVLLFCDGLKTKKKLRVEADAASMQKLFFKVDALQNQTIGGIKSLLALSKKQPK